MSSTEGKVITKLSRRRQIEADLRLMLAAESERELEQMARKLAARGPEVIPALVGSLDRAEGSLLVALGMVAGRLDHTHVQEALVQVLQQPGHSYRARVAAVTILERYLGLRVADDLRPSLAEATADVLSSLGAILDRAGQDPSVLAATVESLDQQEPGVVLAVVGALRSMPGARPVHLLLMLAQDVREEIAAEALQAFGTHPLPEAARALQTLIPTAALALRPTAERLLRKQQFSGVRVELLPSPSPDLRALVGPYDGLELRQIWFIEEAPGPMLPWVVVVHLNAGAGVVAAVQFRRVERRVVPPRRPVGTWPVTWFGSVELTMVEAPFDLGRRIVAEALEYNREQQVPLPGALRLVCGWLWGTGFSGYPLLAAPEPDAGDEALAAGSDRLLTHPTFAEWTLGRQAALAAAEGAIGHRGWDLEVWVRRLATEYLVDLGMAPQLRHKLEANGEWLRLAGEESWACLALATARALSDGHPEQVPFVQALARRDLESALTSLELREPGPGPDSVEGE